MNIKEEIANALSAFSTSKITELETKIAALTTEVNTLKTELASVTTERDALKTERDGLKSQVETLSTSKLAPELLEALKAADIDSAEKLAAKLADANAFSAQQGDKRMEAEKRLAALYTGEELEAEKKLLAALSDGPVLDRQLARINDDYDRKFGTNGKTPASRVSAPSPAAKTALPAATAPTITVTPEQQAAEQEKTRRAF